MLVWFHALQSLKRLVVNVLCCHWEMLDRYTTVALQSELSVLWIVLLFHRIPVWHTSLPPPPPHDYGPHDLNWWLRHNVKRRSPFFPSNQYRFLILLLRDATAEGWAKSSSRELIDLHILHRDSATHPKVWTSNHPRQMPRLCRYIWFIPQRQWKP